MIQINEKVTNWLIDSLVEKVSDLELQLRKTEKEKTEITIEINRLKRCNDENIEAFNIDHNEKYELKSKNKQLENELEEVKTLRKKALETVNELNRELEELKGKYELATTMNKMSGDNKVTKIIGVGRPKK